MTPLYRYNVLSHSHVSPQNHLSPVINKTHASLSTNPFQLLVSYTFHTIQSFCLVRNYQLTWKVTALKQILLLPYATTFTTAKPE